MIIVPLGTKVRRYDEMIITILEFHATQTSFTRILYFISNLFFISRENSEAWIHAFEFKKKSFKYASIVWKCIDKKSIRSPFIKIS